MAKAFKKGKAYMKGEMMKKNASFEDDGQQSPPGEISLLLEVSLRHNA